MIAKRIAQERLEKLYNFKGNVVGAEELRLILAELIDLRGDAIEQPRETAEREVCAQIVNAKCKHVLSKLNGKDSAVDQNLRMMAVLLPDIEAAIRKRGGPTP